MSWTKFVCGVLLLVVAVHGNVADVDAKFESDEFHLDDTCADSEEDCSLQLRQLRGEVKIAAISVHDPKDESGSQDGTVDTQASADDDEPSLFQRIDADQDGFVRANEAVGLLARLGHEDPGSQDSMVNAADEDGDQALSELEFHEAMSKWATTCGAAHASFFCSGTTKIKCCKHGVVWQQCGSVRAWHGCARLIQEPGEEVANNGEEPSEDDGPSLFQRIDVDANGLVRESEVVGLLARLGHENKITQKSMVQAADTDGDEALSALEFNGAMTKWATTCGAAHASFFCSGTTKIKCCKHGVVWQQCGSVRAWHGCGHRLLQEPGEEVADSGEGPSEEDEPSLFQRVDADRDGFVRADEAVGLLARLGHEDPDSQDYMVNAADQDGDQALSELEFHGAMAKWATSCGAAHASFFCSGTTKIKCCKRGAVWQQCGSVRTWHGCARLLQDPEEEVVNSGNEPSGEEDEPSLFQRVDADQDGLVRANEVVGLLARLGHENKISQKSMVQAADADGDEALSALEFNGAMVKWATTCGAAHASFFCSGTTKIKCCKRGVVWKQCGSVRAWHGCR